MLCKRAGPAQGPRPVTKSLPHSLRAANEAAFADSVDVVDDHLERSFALLVLRALFDHGAVEIEHLFGQRHVARIQDADCAGIVARGEHLACVEAGRRKRDIQHASLHGAHGANGDIAIAKLEALIEDGAGFAAITLFPAQG